MLDRGENQPAPLRKTHYRNAVGIDAVLALQKVEGPEGIQGQTIWRAAAVGLDAARTKAVDRERHKAPGCDPFAPAFVKLLPISIATMQQHDGGRGTCAIGLPQIALERKRTGKRTFDFDDDRRRFSRKACTHISEKVRETGGKE